jgi:hypothetical protein
MSNNINNTQPNNPTGAAAAATGEDVTHWQSLWGQYTS